MKNYSKLIWNIDAYKVGHMNQYDPEVEYVQSVFQLRSSRTFTHVPVFGLQYFIEEYLTKPVTHAEVDELTNELKLMGIYPRRKINEKELDGITPIRLFFLRGLCR